jgi:hypothetical protein
MSFPVYMVVVFFVFLLVAIWAWCLIHIVSRPDLKGWTKALWSVGILLFPIIGAAAYWISWLRHGPIDETKAWEGKSTEEIEAEVYRSGPRQTPPI